MINQKFVAASFNQQQQQHHGRTVPKVVDSVEGLQWGTYIGSPSESEPIVIWKAKQVRSLCCCAGEGVGVARLFNNMHEILTFPFR